MEENNVIFLAGDDALVYLAVPTHKKYSAKFVWGQPFSAYVYQDQFFNPYLPCKHMYTIRVTVSAVGLFQKIFLNRIAHMQWTIWRKCYKWYDANATGYMTQMLYDAKTTGNIKDNIIQVKLN